jgi:hypothetical protein
MYHLIGISSGLAVVVKARLDAPEIEQTEEVTDNNRLPEDDLSLST